MITAPERWPSETILTGIFLSARSITSGASMYAAWIRPAIRDSLISGQPLYLLNWYSNRGLPPAAARLLAALATHATGSVRLHVTGKPPICNAPFSAFSAGDRPAGHGGCHECLQHLSALMETIGHISFAV